MKEQPIDFHFPPILRDLERGAQITLPKDLGQIVAYTGMNKTSLVVDAGTGSAFATIFFASIAKKVITYEKRDQFHSFSNVNIARSGLKNIELRNKDIFKGIKEVADIIHLDLPDPEKIFDSKFKLAKDGFIVAYVPNIDQVQRFVKAAESNGYKTFTLESINREISVREYGTRPQTKGLLHTAYLSFAQKSIRNKKDKFNSNSWE